MAIFLSRLVLICGVEFQIGLMRALIRRIVVLFGLLGCVCLLPWGEGLAQEQTPSTSDLEAAPNTQQYPRNPRRRGFPAPQSADANQSNSNPAAGNNQSVQQQNPTVQPPVTQTPAPAPVRTVAPAPQVMVPRPTPQTNGPAVYGPPAPIAKTLEEMAPTPPKVSYTNGLLTVESVNARLADILNAIRVATGIQFEGLHISADRVAGKFGPAPADEVLTTLLQGTRFDYIIIGKPENPSMVQRVILTPSSGSAVAGNPGSVPAQQTSNDDDEDNADESAAETPEPARSPSRMQVPPGRTGDPASPKTAEQLLQELRELQQRQQEQQNQPAQQNQPQAPLKPTVPH